MSVNSICSESDTKVILQKLEARWPRGPQHSASSCNFLIPALSSTKQGKLLPYRFFNNNKTLCHYKNGFEKKYLKSDRFRNTKLTKAKSE